MIQINKKQNLPVIALMGATASGKTALALQLAQKYKIRIISVDSILVYKNLNIGSGKPTKNELDLCPHQLINLLEENQFFSVADFYQLAVEEIKKAHQLNELPLLVGGTMMYYYSLKNGLNELPPKNWMVRKKIKLEIKNKGLEYVYKRLLGYNKSTSIHSNDTQRIIRALELAITDGKNLAKVDKLSENYDMIFCSLNPSSKGQLKKNIQKRTSKMIQNGMIEETKACLAKYSEQNLPPLNSVGYKETVQYLENKLTLEELEEKINQSTLQLAKRQITWLNKFDYYWINNLNIPIDYFLSISKINNIFNNYKLAQC